MINQTRRRQVEIAMELYRHLWERLRDVPLPAARQECLELERKLVQLRAERRALDRTRRRPRRLLLAGD